MAGDRAVRAIVGVEGVAGARFDDADEGAAEQDLSRFEGDIVCGELVGEPGGAVGRVAEHRGGDARLLDLAIAEAQCRNPPLIGFMRFERSPPGHQAGVVGDAVNDRAGLAGIGVDSVQPQVEDLQ